MLSRNPTLYWFVTIAKNNIFVTRAYRMSTSTPTKIVNNLFNIKCLAKISKKLNI